MIVWVSLPKLLRSRWMATRQYRHWLLYTLVVCSTPSSTGRYMERVQRLATRKMRSPRQVSYANSTSSFWNTDAETEQCDYPPIVLIMLIDWHDYSHRFSKSRTLWKAIISFISMPSSQRSPKHLFLNEVPILFFHNLWVICAASCRVVQLK